MRHVLVGLTLLLGCGAPADPQDDGQDAGSGFMCPAPPMLPMCGQSCGNGTIDDCIDHVEIMDCRAYEHGLEACDGTVFRTTCTGLGYFGGEPSCNSCQFDDTSCTACATNAQVAACKPFAADTPLLSAVTDSPAPVHPLIGIAGSDASQHVFTIFDEGAQGLEQVTQRPFVPARALTGTPGGWLAATDTSVIALDTNGATVATTTVWPAGISGSVAFANGPNGRVLVVWSGLNALNKTVVTGAILDATTNVVVPPFAVFFPGSTTPNLVATSDGTSFFVASNGKLARINADGTVAGVQQMFSNSDGRASLTWMGTFGWYVWGSMTNFMAQKFDMTGAPAGMAFGAYLGGTFESAAATSDDVIVLQSTSMSPAGKKFQLVHVGANGTVSTPVDVAVGTGALPLMRIDTKVATAWSAAQQLQLALFAP